MFIGRYNIVKLVPAAASASGALLSVLTVISVLYTEVGYKAQEKQISELIAKYMIENKGLDNRYVKLNYAIACIGDDPSKCDLATPAIKDNTYQDFECGVNVSEIQNSVCPNGKSETSLVHSKSGGKCGYTELFVSCLK